MENDGEEEEEEEEDELVNVLIEGEAEAVPGEEEVGPLRGGDPSHAQVVRHHDQEKVTQVNGWESGDWSFLEKSRLSVRQEKTSVQHGICHQVKTYLEPRIVNSVQYVCCDKYSPVEANLEIIIIWECNIFKRVKYYCENYHVSFYLKFWKLNFLFHRQLSIEEEEDTRENGPKVNFKNTLIKI